jgi:DNA polymerase-3 subunit alpha
MSLDNFVNLHVHTEHSHLDAIIKVKGLSEHLKRVGAAACAVTEHGNLNSAFAFWKELSENGMKPIQGVEFYYVPDRHVKGVSEEHKEKLRQKLGDEEGKKAVRQLGRERYHIVCLAKNNRGWRKMIRAMEVAHKEGFYYMPRIDRELLLDMAGDVIVTTACVGGVPGRLISSGAFGEAKKWVRKIASAFGDDFYLEIQSNDLDIQIEHNLALAKLSQRTGVKLVATNDLHYLSREDAETHDVMLCLRESQYGRKVLVTDTDRFQYGTNQLWLKTRSELEETFERVHPDLPRKAWRQALDHTVEIAAKIDHQVIEPRNAILPKVEIAEEHKGNPDWALWALVKKGWKWRDIVGRTEGKTGKCDWLETEGRDEEIPLTDVYRARIRYEMGLIVKLNFSRYFLVVYDMVRWCRERGIRVGPGRGSVAGSIVAWLLGLTSVDSIRWGCPFSRFISESRVDNPDVDQDVPTDRREEVKQYLRDRYGQDRVAAIANFTTMKGRMVLKDAARVHDVPFHETEQVVSYIGQGGVGDLRSSMELADVFKEFAECREYAKKYPEVVKHAVKLEGNVRQLGVHAAGVVISDEPLRNLVPVQYKRRRGAKEAGEYLTSWDKDQVEAMGLLKLDVLGIDALAYIQRCLDLVKERTGEVIEPEDLEPDDPEVYKNFQEGNTELVWQFNGPGVTRTLQKIMPTKFEHLMATTALIRPGPLYSGVTQDYIKRRHGKAAKGMHKVLDGMLKHTYGLCIYQEDVTRIVHNLGGFSWADADRVRKGAAKKKIELMEVWEPKFIEGAQKFGLSEDDAGRIWSALVEFSKYGFNRCLVGETKLSGGGDRIEEIIGRQGCVLKAYSRNGQVVEDEVVRVIDAGEQEVYEIKFDDGSVVVSTLDHKFLCSDGNYHTVHEIAERGLYAAQTENEGRRTVHGAKVQRGFERFSNSCAVQGQVQDEQDGL